jgi:carboxypeptidase C (cathepsin A)
LLDRTCTNRLPRGLFMIALLCAGAISAARAQTSAPLPPEPAASGALSQSAPPAIDPNRLPADATTHHTLELPGRTLHFTATAGSIRLRDDKNVPQADVAFVAYQLDGADRLTRPVTFAFNGGPGMASGWLQVGAIGPWRVALQGASGVPSGSPAPIPNAETWLDFTDLVFIDPPGTGYSRILTSEDASERRFWSVRGDIDTFAEVIRRWLDRSDRMVSPKYLVGESYGGFRAPRLARELQSTDGVGVTGMVLLSPVLDFHSESGITDPMGWVGKLPSEVAAARALKGPVTRADVADVELYAATDYVTDLLRGERDAAALDRLAARVAALTGLDAALVRRLHGRLDADVFLHELQRAQGRVGSQYDATITDADPFPHRLLSQYADPVLEGFKAPITGAMVALYTGQLNWRPEGVYRLSNDTVFERWDWGRGMGRPESLTALQTALALDPRLHVLIAHGLFDLRTPYFASELIVRGLPDVGPPDRVRLAVYPGGHMFYADDASRAALRRDATALFGD